jgi:hypothetical protein
MWQILRLAAPDADAGQGSEPGCERLLAAPPGRVFLVGRLPHLVLRCYAEVIEYSGDQAQLGGFFRREQWFGKALLERHTDGEGWLSVDQVYRTAVALYNFHRGLHPSADRPEWTAPGIVQWIDPALVPLPAGQLRGWLAVAGVLLDVVVRGLPRSAARAILDEEHPELANDLRLGAADVDHLFGYLVTSIFIDMEYFIADRTVEQAAFLFGCESLELLDLFPKAPTSWVAGASLRNVVLDRTEDRDRLLRLWRSEEVRRYLEEHGEEARLRLIWFAPWRGGTRRVRMVPAPSPTRQGRHLDLADDVMACALFELVAAGFDLVAVLGECFLLEVDEASAEALADRARSIVDEVIWTKMPLRFAPKPFCRVRIRKEC